MHNFRSRLLPLITALFTAASLAACTPTTDAGTPAAAETRTTAPASGTAAAAPEDTGKPSQPAAAGTALEQLATITIKGRAPKTGYTREQFGNGWQDPDRNGCDARNDTLARALNGETFKAGTNDCIVLTGTLQDPYTGTTIEFVRGNQTSTLVQIDHVVALSDAWQKGAQQLTAGQRESFANDPLNLLAADGPTNGAKGDGDAATWLPPNKAFRCDYVARQTAVKAKYGLWMTQAEHDAIKEILSTSCPDQTVPTANGEAADPGSGKPAQLPAAPGGAGVVYGSCADVRANGAAPIRVGDPGWDTKFDGDGDGIGCES